METLMLILLMICAVLISSVIDQLVPKVSSPLIQIALGLIIGLLSGGAVDIIFEESDLFLVLFIAPLLFHEAKEANKIELWRNKKSILSLAIGLVLAIILAVGFFTNAIIPSISLAAALALGAALGPTDPVAVSAAAKDADISVRCKAMLKGESLINDASGIVAFQFAISAAMTGMFSPANAISEFLLEFFGGIFIGLVLGYIANAIVRLVRSWGLDNTTFHVLFEIFTPFIVYLVAHQLGGSGILAVVAAGLMNVISPRTAGPSVSRLNIVSSSVWRVLSFTLNGIVFVLLGTQLPRGMQSTWNDVTIPNIELLGYVLAISLILVVVRFLWVLIQERIHHKKEYRENVKASNETGILAKPAKTFAHDVRASAIMTFGGAKGTITLAVILTLPQAIYQRELITFIACGVIVVTLLMATFFVPILAPKKKRISDEQKARDTQTSLDIFRTVIEELTKKMTDENRHATQAVIHDYNDRIERVKDANGIDDEPNIKLRLRTLEWENKFVNDKIQKGEVDHFVGYQYLTRIARMEELLRHKHSTRAEAHQRIVKLRSFMRKSAHALMHRVPKTELGENMQEMRNLQIESYENVIEKLQAELTGNSCANTEDISKLLVEYQRLVQTLRNTSPSLTTISKNSNKRDNIKRQALEIELEQIDTFYDDGNLSRAMAKRMRENVHLMMMDLEDNV